MMGSGVTQERCRNMAKVVRDVEDWTKVEDLNDQFIWIYQLTKEEWKLKYLPRQQNSSFS